MHKEFKQSFSKWQIIRGEQMPMGSKGWNEVPGILKGEGNTYVECSHFQGCSSLGAVLSSDFVFVVFWHCFFLLFTYILPLTNKWCHSCQTETDFLSTLFLDVCSFHLSSSFPGHSLSFHKIARIWHFVTVSLSYLLFIPHLLPKAVLGGLTMEDVILYLVSKILDWT